MSIPAWRSTSSSSFDIWTPCLLYTSFAVLRDLDPDVRAIVSSGYDNEEMAKQYLDMGFCGYLTKPYRVTDLGKVLKAVLG